MHEDGSSECTLSEKLCTEQREQLEVLLQKYKDVFKSKPGKTTATKHFIHTADSRAVKQHPYQLQWAMAECTYRGHVVGGGYAKPEINKLEAVENFPVPKAKKEVRSFLGLTGYYRCFIKEYTSMEVPLTNLTRKKYPEIVAWTAECDKAFNALNNMLRFTPVFSSPDFEKTFILETEASNYGVGAILSQTDGQGLDHPVVYFSVRYLTESRNTPQLRKNV